ncbi:MAG: (2Fe-2S)-binding protein [bacterium]|nr:(2Fe-2S)-binding protein [bacterium]
MRIEVNGAGHNVTSPPLASLLTVLREEMDVTSVKAGCESGGCGACTVLIDGQPRRSCLTPVVTAVGSEVTTVEGLGTPDSPSAIQQSFIHHYAMQCGFCTPGLVVAATAYVNGGGSDDLDSVAEAISGHVCRCTGYNKILEAVAAAVKSSEFDLSSTAVDKNTVVIKTGGAV